MFLIQSFYFTAKSKRMLPVFWPRPAQNIKSVKCFIVNYALQLIIIMNDILFHSNTFFIIL